MARARRPPSAFAEGGRTSGRSAPLRGVALSQCSPLPTPCARAPAPRRVAPRSPVRRTRTFEKFARARARAAGERGAAARPPQPDWSPRSAKSAPSPMSPRTPRFKTRGQFQRETHPAFSVPTPPGPILKKKKKSAPYSSRPAARPVRADRATLRTQVNQPTGRARAVASFSFLRGPFSR